jgi:hypothetical protein
MSQAALPVWRSMLFVPVTVEKYVARAAERGADALILDLEDSVPLAEKPRGREVLQEAAATVAKDGADVVVRINRAWRLAIRDIEAAVSPMVQALMLTKVESAEHVQMLAEVVSELEAERGMASGATKFVALVETASGFLRIAEIARAHLRLVALSIGAEDFALSVGMLPEAEGLFFPKQQMIIAARAAGILPLGLSAPSPTSATSTPSARPSAARADWDSWAPPASTRRKWRSSTRNTARRPTRWRRPSAPSRLTTRRPPPASAPSSSTAR